MKTQTWVIILTNVCLEKSRPVVKFITQPIYFFEATSRHISPPGDSPLPKVGVHFKGSGGGRIIPPVDLFTFLCLITCLCCFNNSAAVIDWIMVVV
jgi:hypothetical protein